MLIRHYDIPIVWNDSVARVPRLFCFNNYKLISIQPLLTIFIPLIVILPKLRPPGLHFVIRLAKLISLLQHNLLIPAAAVALTIANHDNLHQSVKAQIAVVCLIIHTQLRHWRPLCTAFDRLMKHNKTKHQVNKRISWRQVAIPHMIEDFSQIMMTLHQSHVSDPRLEASLPFFRYRLNRLLNQPNDLIVRLFFGFRPHV